MICLAVTFIVKPGSEKAAAAIFRTLTEHSRAEPGCRMYLFHSSPADPRKFFVYEQYDDQAAIEAHRAAPYYERYVKKELPPLVESVDLQTYVPLTD